MQQQPPQRPVSKVKPKERQSRGKGVNQPRFELRYFEEHGYTIIGEVGKGGYGMVYVACRENRDVLYAVKVNFGTVRMETIYTELMLMTLVEGYSHMIRLVDMFRHGSQYHLVTGFFPHVPFIALLQRFQLEDVKHYLYQLLKSVARLKALGIYHRDIKPSNFLYNPSQKYGILTDFGLSEVDPDFVTEMEARARQETSPKLQARLELYREVVRMNSQTGRLKFGTELYMPLESLMKWEKQSYSSDIWPVGVIFLQFILKKFYVFNSFLEKADCTDLKKNERRIVTFLVELASLFGTNKVREGCESLGVKIAQYPQPQTGIADFRKVSCIQLDEVGEDLLRKLLEINPRKRISADEALRHDFFREIRKGKRQQ